MSVLCGESAALGASLGVGPAPKVVCRSKSATPPSSPFLLGTASPWSNLAAIPPHRSRDESRPPCSGQPGYGRPGRWRRQCQSSQICSATYVAAQNPRCQPQTARLRTHQRRCLVLLFEGQCLFAFTLVPRSNDSAALTPLGRPGPGRGGRLPTLRAGLFRCSREPKVSLPRRSRARRPHTQDRLRGHAPLRSASYGTARLLAATRTTLAQPPGG